ncbi:MAG TPA: protein kinase [Drouetiella sp.]|jgi:serine/threonine protein kinase
MDSDSLKQERRLHARTCWLFGQQNDKHKRAFAFVTSHSANENLHSTPAKSQLLAMDEKTGGGTDSGSDGSGDITSVDSIHETDETKEAHLDEEFEILGTIGAGAICNVYAVRSKSLNRQFALKILKDELTSNTAAVKQFKKEVDASVSLTHINIAAVYGHGKTEQGAPFVVQQLCNGNNLAEMIKQGPLAVERALDIFKQICDAMSHAHTKAVLHRDLKPSNVVITNSDGSDVVRLIDFGMSSVMQSARSAVTDVTRTGEVFGTPHYMSPEQCIGTRVNELSDIYSFGCLMYEVLCGSPPFNGINPVQVILRHLKEVPPPFHDCVDYSTKTKRVEQMVMRCLRKEPAERYQSFDEVKSELEAIAAGNTIATYSADTVPKTTDRFLASVVDGAAIYGACSLVATLMFLASALLSGVPPLPFNAAAVLPFVQVMFWATPEFQVLNGLSMLSIPTFFSPLAVFCVAIYPAVACAYHAIFESSKMQATPGKRLFGLVVLNQNGNRLSFQQATVRFWSRVLAPFFVVIELMFAMEQGKWQTQIRNSLKYLPTDRLTQMFVVKRSVRDQIALKGLSYPAPFGRSIETTHRHIKRSNRFLILAALVIAVDLWHQLTLLRAGDVLQAPNFLFVIMSSVFFATGLGYRAFLVKTERRLLGIRQANEIDCLSSWVESRGEGEDQKH